MTVLFSLYRTIFFLSIYKAHVAWYYSCTLACLSTHECHKTWARQRWNLRRSDGRDARPRVIFWTRLTSTLTWICMHDVAVPAQPRKTNLKNCISPLICLVSKVRTYDMRIGWLRSCVQVDCCQEITSGFSQVICLHGQFRQPWIVIVITAVGVPAP